MAKFILIPSKIREDRVVPIKGSEKLELDMEGLCALFQPTAEEMKIVGFVGISGYIGKLKAGPREKLFYFRNRDFSNNIGWILKSDPMIAEKVSSLYFVEKVELDGKMTEIPSGRNEAER